MDSATKSSYSSPSSASCATTAATTTARDTVVAEAIHLNNTGVQLLATTDAAPQDALVFFKRALSVLHHRPDAGTAYAASAAASLRRLNGPSCTTMLPLPSFAAPAPPPTTTDSTAGEEEMKSSTAYTPSNDKNSYLQLYGSAVLISPDIAVLMTTTPSHLQQQTTMSVADLAFCTAVMMLNTALTYHSMAMLHQQQSRGSVVKLLQKASSMYQVAARTLIYGSNIHHGHNTTMMTPLYYYHSSPTTTFLICAALNNELAITLQLQGPCVAAHIIKTQLVALFQQGDALNEFQSPIWTSTPSTTSQDGGTFLNELYLNLVILNTTDTFAHLPAPVA